MNLKKYIKLSGTIIKGTGKSNIWMPSTIPYLYPGTLNVKLESYRPDIEWHTTLDVKHPKWHQYIVRIGNCLINGIPANIILPPGFKYVKRYDWLELGHPKKLRDLLNLEDGSNVDIIFVQGQDKTFVS